MHPFHVPIIFSVKIEVVGSQDVLMVNFENNYYPVCSEDFDEGWGNNICDAMGFG